MNAIFWPLNTEGKILDEDGSQGMAGRTTGCIKSEVHVCSNNPFYTRMQNREGYERYRILGQL